MEGLEFLHKSLLPRIYFTLTKENHYAAVVVVVVTGRVVVVVTAAVVEVVVTTADASDANVLLTYTVF